MPWKTVDYVDGGDIDKEIKLGVIKERRWSVYLDCSFCCVSYYISGRRFTGVAALDAYIYRSSHLLAAAAASLQPSAILCKDTRVNSQLH
jgi:hypothetical protein